MIRLFLKGLLKNGLVLAILTAIGYTLTYFYLKGYYGFYGIPITLINITLPLIINTILIVFLLTIFLLFLVNAVLRIFSMLFSLHSYFIKWLRLSITLGLLILAFFLMLKEAGLVLYIILLALIIFIWIFAFINLLKYRKIKPWLEKLNKANEDLEKSLIFKKADQTKAEDDDSCKSPLLKKATSSVQILIGLFIIVYLSLSIIGVAVTKYGSLAASGKREYYTAVDYNNLVIVYQDNDKFILMPHNKKTGEFTSSYKIVSIEDIGTVEPILLKKVSIPETQNPSINDLLNGLIFY